ncbi:MAG: hypothetical protein ACKOFT_08485 [Actinomycetota bacterium]
MSQGSGAVHVDGDHARGPVRGQACGDP